MPLPFLLKIASAGHPSAALGVEERDLLLSACSNVRTVPARRDIIREGDNPEYVHMVVSGWICRYKTLPNGSRQIVAFLLPGDFCDMHVTMLDSIDHNIGTLTNCTVALLPKEAIFALAQSPRISCALWWGGLVDEAILRSWIVNLGRRDAFERIAHLICELHARLCNVGLTTDGSFDLPLTQEELADALGLTSVHVNRSLKLLRERSLATMTKGLITIHDMTALRKAAGFSANYLHLSRGPPSAYQPPRAIN